MEKPQCVGCLGFFSRYSLDNPQKGQSQHCEPSLQPLRGHREYTCRPHIKVITPVISFFNLLTRSRDPAGSD